MRFINWWIDRIAISGLVVASSLLWLTTAILSLSLLFNFPPYITYHEGGSAIGLTDYSKGIPVVVDINASIPDTSIYCKTKHGETQAWHIWKKFPGRDDRLEEGAFLQADTIITTYELGHHENNRSCLQATGLTFGSGAAYFHTNSSFQKIMLSLPSLLKYAVLAYAAWQLAMLLSYIQSGEAFVSRNYQRLSKIGWAVAGLYISMFFYEILLKQFDFLHVSFSSSNPDYRTPFSIDAYPENEIGITWLIAGCIILILAKAFQKGSRLQQEQDLTV